MSRFTQNVVASVIGLVGALGLCEVVVRMVPRRFLPELGPVQQRAFELTGTMRPSTNRQLQFELIPNNATVEVNAAGYRGALVSAVKPTGTKRIVGIGDSTMFGLGVADADGYMRQLEGLLRAESTCVEVVNLAVAGYNSEQELEVLQSRGLAFRPDLVVLGYDHNDAKAIPHHNVRGPLPDDYGRNLLHSELVRYVRRKLYLSPEFSRHRRVDGHVTGGPGWDRHLQALGAFGDTLRARGIPAVVVVYDAWIQREDKTRSRHYQRLHARLDRVWKQHGFHVLDCYDLFQEHMRAQGRNDTQDLWVSIPLRDGHPNPHGHRLIAAALARLIERERLLQ